MDALQERLARILEAANWDSDEDESFFAEIDEVRQNAIAEFAFDRLRSYYLNNTSLYIPVKRRLFEAKDLRDFNASASLVFSLSASEVCLKNLILRPMVYGFVHQAYIAKAIADLAVSHMGWDRFKELLEAILRENLGIDLAQAKIGRKNKLLWSEFNRLANIRNGIIHKTTTTSYQESGVSIEIAEEFCCGIFPTLLHNFSLAVNESGQIVEEHDDL
jgi:hypothetical protein